MSRSEVSTCADKNIAALRIFLNFFHKQRRMRQSILLAAGFAALCIGAFFIGSPTAVGGVIGTVSASSDSVGLGLILLSTVLLGATLGYSSEDEPKSLLQYALLKKELGSMEKSHAPFSGLSQDDARAGVSFSERDLKELSDMIEQMVDELPSEATRGPLRAYAFGSLVPNKHGLRSREQDAGIRGKFGERSSTKTDVKYVTDVDIAIVSNSLYDFIRDHYPTLVKQDGRRGERSANFTSTIELKDERFSIPSTHQNAYNRYDDLHTQEELPSFLRRFHDHMQAYSFAGRGDRPLNIRIFSEKGETFSGAAEENGKVLLVSLNGKKQYSRAA